MLEAESNAGEMAEALRRYAEALPRVVFGSLQAWTALAADDVRNAAPIDTGGLAASCHGYANQGPDGPDAEIVAGREYAPPVEFGSAPHEIVPVRKLVLRWPAEGGGWAFATSVQHPGTAPQPFFFDTIAGDLDDLSALTSDSLAELGRRVGLEGGGR